jgi:hypothetical protein
MISTNVKVGGNSTPKTLQPGNRSFKITNVLLQDSPWKDKPGAKNLILMVEGPSLGDDFEGFFIDKQNESLGRHNCQVGRVRTNNFPYSDGVTKGGIQIQRDEEILKAIKNLCQTMKIEDWYDAQDNKHETIEDIINQFNTDAPYKDIFLDACLAARQYENKQGYPNYDLFLPNFGKGKVPYELTDSKPSKLIKFDEATHIIVSKTKTVENFEANSDPATPVTGAIPKGFSL